MNHVLSSLSLTALLLALVTLLAPACSEAKAGEPECCRKASELIQKMDSCCVDNLGKPVAEMTGCCTQGMQPDNADRPECCASALKLRSEMAPCCQEGMKNASTVCCKEIP